MSVPQPITESSSMKYYRVPAGTGPPEVGEKYTILHWPLHRINALSQGPLKGEYKLDENIVKFYQTTKDGFVVPGCSSFVPLNSRHNVPSRRLLGPESPCYFLSPGTVLPDGLAIVYTKKMKTRFPSDLQHLWHFNIFPTSSMTLHEYSNMIKNLDWKPCNIKTESVTLETYRADILGELEDRFMWKESDFFDPKDEVSVKIKINCIFLHEKP
ncbi:hypothetical protein C1646_819843 [Rhizophagus diaphanus]|nr:hypothetical protein C1646_819843 [Rhizophagus diaphanus] [Rhizophagus sp. MUCL 43196]